MLVSGVKESPKTIELDQFSRRVVAMKVMEANDSPTAVAKLSGLSRQTIYRLKHRSSPVRKPGSGRRSILSPAAKAFITKSNKEVLGASVRATASRLAASGYKGSATTIRLNIKCQTWGYAYKPQRIPGLTEKNIKVPGSVVKHSNGGSVMVSAVLTARGLTDLFIVPEGTTINSEFYRTEML